MMPRAVMPIRTPRASKGSSKRGRHLEEVYGERPHTPSHTHTHTHTLAAADSARLWGGGGLRSPCCSICQMLLEQLMMEAVVTLHAAHPGCWARQALA
jgi:hypothetical protein